MHMHVVLQSHTSACNAHKPLRLTRELHLYSVTSPLSVILPHCSKSEMISILTPMVKCNYLSDHRMILLSALILISACASQTGPLPDTLGNLSNLRVLSLRKNAIDGSLPSTLGSLAKLEHLSIEQCRLTGDIPLELGKLPALKAMNLQGNKFGNKSRAREHLIQQLPHCVVYI